MYPTSHFFVACHGLLNYQQLKNRCRKTQTMNNTMDKKVHNKDNSKIRQQEKD